MIDFSDYGKSVQMMSTKQWVQRAADVMVDPNRRDIITSFNSDRDRTEALVSFVAAESLPYERATAGMPYFNMRIGKVLWAIETGLRQGLDFPAVLQAYESGVSSFYSQAHLSN